LIETILSSRVFRTFFFLFCKTSEILLYTLSIYVKSSSWWAWRFFMNFPVWLWPSIMSLFFLWISLSLSIFFAYSLSWISIPSSKYWSSVFSSIISRGRVELSLILLFNSSMTSLYSASLFMYLCWFSSRLTSFSFIWSFKSLY